MWWFMADPGNPWGLWWNAAGDCCPPADAAGEMKFDLNGAANFTYYRGPGAAPVTGSFVLDVKNQTLQINGANILGAEEPRGNPKDCTRSLHLLKINWFCLFQIMPVVLGGPGFLNLKDSI